MSLEDKILKIKINKKHIITEEQLSKLNELKVNGKEFLNNYTAYEIIAAIKEYGFDHIYNYLKKYTEKYKTIEDVIINLPSMINEKKKLINEINNFGNMTKAKSGISCISCGSDRTFAIQKQIRSSDEPSTLFVRCSVCSKSWRIG